MTQPNPKQISEVSNGAQRAPAGASPGSKTWVLLVSLTATVLTLALWFWHSTERTAKAPEVTPGPVFGQPEQAARYRQAVSDGNERGIRVLEEALERALEQREPNAINVERIRRELQTKRAALAEVQ